MRNDELRVEGYSVNLAHFRGDASYVEISIKVGREKTTRKLKFILTPCAELGDDASIFKGDEQANLLAKENRYAYGFLYNFSRIILGMPTVLSRPTVPNK